MSFDFSPIRSKFQEVVDIVNHDLKSIKTGRAKPSLVEDIKVEAYGSMMPLNELASITAPDASLLVIQPWDQSVIAGVEKALMQNQFNPSVDGQTIRVAIPTLTGEKRQELIKQVHQRIESGKQMLRSERTDAKKAIEAQKGQPGISEDNIKADNENLDKLTNEFTGKLDEVGAAKEKELNTI